VSWGHHTCPILPWEAAPFVLAIVDDGQGFDWKQHLDLEENLSGVSHGRGIAMSRLISFDHLEYRGRGNHVVVTAQLDPPPAGSDGPERAEAA